MTFPYLHLDSYPTCFCPVDDTDHGWCPDDHLHSSDDNTCEFHCISGYTGEYCEIGESFTQLVTLQTIQSTKNKIVCSTNKSSTYLTRLDSTLSRPYLDVLNSSRLWSQLFFTSLIEYINDRGEI